MIADTTKELVVVLVGATSLYLLLALFQRCLPTRLAAGVRKLNRMSIADAASSSKPRVGVEHCPRAIEALRESRLRREPRTQLARKLQYAGWSISPALFRALSFGLGVALALGTLPYLDFFMAPFVAFAGPCLMNVLLRRSIERRTRRFSDDYPQLLMMAVALLKTGLPPTSALEAAARGLEGHSLVRSEVFAMLERMRMGLPEEKSIGVFGESISHPEIELFVQSLLLGLRVGGSLTDSLERLSTQARRREYFKRSAVASVAQQRGSMVAITLIMLALSSFLAVCAPAMASGLYRHPLGFKVIEVAAIVLLCAVGWLQQITRIRL